MQCTDCFKEIKNYHYCKHETPYKQHRWDKAFCNLCFLCRIKKALKIFKRI